MRHTGLLLAVALLVPVAAYAQQGSRPADAPIADRPFKDVPRDHWAYDAVEQMRKLGILRGYPPEPSAVSKLAPKVKPAPAKRPRR
jgi:hypothetical protein